MNTFGITRPTPQQEVRAGQFIAVMLVLVVLGLGALVWLLHNALAH